MKQQMLEFTMEPERFSFTTLYCPYLKPGGIIEPNCGALYNRPKNEEWHIESCKHVRYDYGPDTTEVNGVIVTITRWQRIKRWFRMEWNTLKRCLRG
jgi:hypothetical protein